MNDVSRIQVREDSTDHDWIDVGHKAGDESVPVEITGTVPIPTGAATSVNQDTQITNSKVFKLNHVDNYTTTNVVYLGSETNAGEWQFLKIDQTGSFPVFSYASITNNATRTTYSLAYTNRVTLTYELYSLAF